MRGWARIRRNTVLLTVLVLPLIASCRLHSPFQEELAKDIQARYKLVSPSALQALEVLDSDLDKLLDSERADFEVYRETSENEVINITWSGYRGTVRGLQNRYFLANGAEQGVAAAVKDGIQKEGKTIRELNLRIEELGSIIGSLNKALKKAEESASTLAADLEDTKTIITGALTAIKTATDKDPNSPLAKRLSASLGDTDKFLKELSNNRLKREQSDQVFSLIIEAMRLGRDVTALEKEAVEQEQSYHERLLALYQAEKKILPSKLELETMHSRFQGRFNDNEMVRETISVLARQVSRAEELAASLDQQAQDVSRKADENDREARSLNANASKRGVNKRAVQAKVIELYSFARTNRASAQQSTLEARRLRNQANQNREVVRAILEDMARLQTLTLTDGMRVKELELRRGAEKFRNAKLKDVIFERQRITLITYGLDGVVRYAEGGLRSEDIASLINIASMVAQFVIAARV